MKRTYKDIDDCPIKIGDIVAVATNMGLTKACSSAQKKVLPPVENGESTYICYFFHIFALNGFSPSSRMAAMRRPRETMSKFPS